MAVSFETKRESLLDEGAQLSTSKSVETKRNKLDSEDQEATVELLKSPKSSTSSETKRETLETEGEAVLEPLISLDEVRVANQHAKVLHN